MTTICPQCKGVFPEEENCAQRFERSQLIEIEQPAYYAVHHLSVPCYMLQHNSYSRQGWLAVRTLLAQFIHDGLMPVQARRMITAEQRKGRTYSLTRGEKHPQVEAIPWRMTIADVRLDSAGHYCADVRAWAESILADSEGILP